MSEKKDLVTHLVLGLSSIDDGVGARASAGDGDKWRREDSLRLKDLAILHMRSSLVSDGPSLDMTSSSLLRLFPRPSQRSISRMRTDDCQWYGSDREQLELELCRHPDPHPLDLSSTSNITFCQWPFYVYPRNFFKKRNVRLGVGHLTTLPYVVAKNHLFSAFVSATKSNFCPKRQRPKFFFEDLFPAKICPETLKTHGNGL